MKKTFLWLLFSLSISACQNSDQNQSNKKLIKAKTELFGNTQGTTYSVICNDEISLNSKEIDSLLTVFDYELSIYIDSSFVSKFNHIKTGEIDYHSENNYFKNCLMLAQQVYLLSEGAFDPSVLPLVDAWSFFKKDRNEIPDSSKVDSLRSLVSFDNGKHFKYEQNEFTGLTKISPGFRLDFNAIAQGYSVDVLYEYLKAKGANNFYIEIGGEIRVSGRKTDGTQWLIGIDKPLEDSKKREMLSYINIENQSVATSGNYRKFYQKNGVKYSHTIDPKTGYPVQHSLLSATVVTDNCAFADGFATQFMVMGVDKSMEFVKKHPELNLAVYFIFENSDGRMEVAYNHQFEKLMLKD